MDDEEKKAKRKEKMQNAGSTIGNIVKIVKRLANPVIRWIAIAILIIVLLIGVIGFIISFPSGVLGNLTGNLFGWTKYSDRVYKVSQEDLIEVCKYLEEMGITDLEGYGFVEEIERGEPIYNNDGVQTSKGEIKSVKSKYLEAYLVAERKSYVVDDYLEDLLGSVLGDYKLAYTNGRELQYEQLIFDLAFNETFEEFWETEGNYENTEFRDIIEKIYSYNSEDGYYTLKDDQNSEFSKINKDEMRNKVKTMILAYYKFETTIGRETIEAFRYGEKLIGDNENFREQFRQILNTKISEKKAQYSKEDLVGTGLIHIVGSRLNEGEVTVDDNKISIDEEKRQLIINTAQINNIWDKIFASFGLATKYTYAYDLNNWTCKYGKPVEFLIAMHLATGAPDFVYQVATSPAVDTKVYVDLFPVSNSLSIVTEDGGDKTAMELIEEACKDSLKKYKDTAKSIINEDVKKILLVEGEEGHLVKPAEEIIDTLLTKISNAQTVKDIIGVLTASIVSMNSNDSTNITNKITELENKKNITITLNGEELEYSYNEIKKIKEQLGNYESTSYNSATPYITKVVNHWYRNQYFTEENTINLSTKKTRITSLINTVANFVYNEREPGNILNSEVIYVDGKIYYIGDQIYIVYENIDNEIEDAKNTAISKLDEIEEEGIDDYLNKQKETWLNLAKDDETKTKIENEFEAVKKEFEEKVTGSAYTVTGAPEPFYQSIADTSADTFGGDETVQKFMKKLWIKETRSSDIIQTHNPVFEDNSQYIRNWLKEKYYIYGTSNTTQEDATTETLSDAKVSQGKQYIDGKVALETIKGMLKECEEERKDITYMLRDLKELFEDFEFDLENVEIPAEKVLDNVMPSYVPYTPWPSIYETAEDNCTKMIYKTEEETELIAPAQGIITRVQDNIIEIKFTTDDEKTSSTNGMILNIEIEKGTLIEHNGVNSVSNRGDKIAKVKPSSDGMIILKLRLFSATKQLLEIENYMTVYHKSYDGEYSITEEEKIYLYNLQETEIDIETNGWFYTGGEKQETITSRVALMNIVFNKISSPYYPKYKDIASILGNIDPAKNENFFSYASYIKENGPSPNINLTKLENTEGRYAIENALSGVDITKTYTLIGATTYIPIDDNYYKNNDANTEKDGKLEEAENLIMKFQLGNRILGITEEEYLNYIGDIIEKKINEVIYTQNIKKYTQGFQEYEEVLEQFKEAKAEVIDYYKNKVFLEECSNGRVVESMGIITSISKRNIGQEVEQIEGQEGKEKVVDTFTITANSNYSTIWTFTYVKGAEGKIEGDIKVEHKPIVNI